MFPQRRLGCCRLPGRCAQVKIDSTDGETHDCCFTDNVEQQQINEIYDQAVQCQRLVLPIVTTHIRTAVIDIDNTTFFTLPRAIPIDLSDQRALSPDGTPSTYSRATSAASIKRLAFIPRSSPRFPISLSRPPVVPHRLLLWWPYWLRHAIYSSVLRHTVIHNFRNMRSYVSF